MNPTNNDEPSSVLPPVVDDQHIPTVNAQDPAAQVADSATPTAALPPFPANGLTAPAVAPTLNVPDEAADVDLIEKEWVEKAKQIVEHTIDDPYTQQEELGKIKAEYLKKRYNKDVGAA